MVPIRSLPSPIPPLPIRTQTLSSLLAEERFCLFSPSPTALPPTISSDFCGSYADRSSGIRAIRCESFSTYPRTYDLLHAWNLFSEIEKQGCSFEDLLIEMDRILRPHGFAIIRDEAFVINYIRRYLPALRWWDAWSSEVEPTVDALSSSEEERVLIVQKRLWVEGPVIM